MPSQATEAPGPRKLDTALRWLALAVFAVLLTVNLGSREYWLDETITRGHIESLELTRDAFHPSGYYRLLYGWKMLFGEGDLSLRVFSVPWGLLCLGLMALVGDRLLPRRTVTLAMWLFALSPFIVLYFRMARFYSLVAAAAVFALWAAVCVVQEGRWRHWVLLSLSALVLLGLNFVAASLLPLLFLALLWQAARRRQWAQWAVAVVPSTAVVLYLLQMLLSHARVVAGLEPIVGHGPILKALVELLLPFWSLAVGETTDPWRVWVTGPMLVAVSGGWWLGMRRGGDGGWGVVRLLWPVAVAAMTLILGTVARAEPLTSAARSCLFAAPAAYLTVAAGLASLRRRWVAAAAIAALLVGNGYGLWNYFAGRQFLNPAYATPWRQIARTIEEQQKPGDLVLTFFDTTVLQYGRFPGFIPARPNTTAEEVEEVRTWPQGGQRLWLIARDRGSAAARRLQSETLAALTPRAGRVDKISFMPYSELDRRLRELILKRPVEEAYIQVYLFTPPAPGATR
jgi:4-amino-4-deoxy-L-arabinose transferase-like glycosyltransferase